MEKHTTAMSVPESLHGVQKDSGALTVLARRAACKNELMLFPRIYLGELGKTGLIPEENAGEDKS